MASRNLNHHLQHRNGHWRVRLEIPEALRPRFGKRFFIEPLGSVSLSQARMLRDQMLIRWRLLLAQASDPTDEVLRDVRIIRHRLLTEDNENFTIDDHPGLDAIRLADEVEEREGVEAANYVHALAFGAVSPLDEYLDDWITDKGFIGKTALQHRKAFSVLIDWCRGQHLQLTHQAITERVAWQFIEKHLERTIATRKTLNRYLSSYRTHWRWLKRRHRVEDNPWLDTHQSDNGHNKGDDEGSDQRKRAFTDDEVRTLLSGDAIPEPLPDLMRVAALTGARVDAICSLRVRDCHDGAFTFKRAKKEPRDRTIPVHSGLKVIMARRMKGKGAEEFIFHELPAATPTRPRSASASQAFTRYRRTVGVGAAEGEQSPVDFHSFRRWFTTMAERAEQPPHIIDYVTGHKRPGETLGRYSEGPSMQQMRKCVEAVKLPSYEL